MAYKTIEKKLMDKQACGECGRRRPEKRAVYELQESDVGLELGQSMGRVLRNDVGKRVVLNPRGILMMENNEQRDRRAQKKSFKEPDNLRFFGANRGLA